MSKGYAVFIASLAACVVAVWFDWMLVAMAFCAIAALVFGIRIGLWAAAEALANPEDQGWSKTRQRLREFGAPVP